MGKFVECWTCNEPVLEHCAGSLPIQRMSLKTLQTCEIMYKDMIHSKHYDHNEPNSAQENWEVSRRAGFRYPSEGQLCTPCPTLSMVTLRFRVPDIYYILMMESAKCTKKCRSQVEKLKISLLTCWKCILWTRSTDTLAGEASVAGKN